MAASGYVDLRTSEGRGRFFGAVRSYGSATLTKEPHDGPGVVVQCDFTPAQYEWRNGQKYKVSDDQIAYYAYMINGKRLVSGAAGAGDIVDWLLRNGWVTRGYCEQVGSVDDGEEAKEKKLDGEVPLQPILIGLFAFAALAGVGLVWLTPLVEQAFLMIGNALSFMVKLGFFGFLAWLAYALWRAAGPLPDGTEV